MLSGLYIPQFPLSEFIENFWITHKVIGPNNSHQEKILPDGHITLIINLGEFSHKMLNKGNDTIQKQYSKSWISGQQKEFILVESFKERNMIGIRFKPGGAYPFFKFPISELTGQVIELDLIWGSLVDEIREQIMEAGTLTAKFQILEKLLLQKANGNFEQNKIIQYGIQQILQSSHENSINKLSKNIGISHKHLDRQFNKIVGLTPKPLYRINRFQQVIKRIQKWETIDWLSIAYECGYYDQAHFIREFKFYTGLTPSEYHTKYNGQYNGKFIPISQ